ncbi:PorT family protein [Bacteroidia bacterium]|nr:PorT family protein [Bacteroidia bacterium]
MTNKKNCLLILIFLFSIGLVAQDAAPAKKTQFGFRVSPNLTWSKIKSGPVEGDGTGLGFSYGLMADYNFSQNYFLSFEALVTSMRNKIVSKDSLYQGEQGVGAYYANVKQDYKLQYLQIPVSLKMKTNYINGMRYYFQAGLAPGFLISRNVTTSASPALPKEGEWYSPNASDNDKGDFQEDPSNPESQAFTNNVGLFRVPLIIGAGFEYKLSGNTALTAGLRWDNGFTDIYRDKNTVGINNYLGLSVGILF